VDAEAACIICNWANNILWPYFGLGALGAAAAAAAAGGVFGGGSSSGGGDGSQDGGGGAGSDPRNYDRDPNADDVGDVTPRPPPRRAPALTNLDNWLRDMTEGISGEDGHRWDADRGDIPPHWWRGGTTRN
jgi:hypothetical protein